MLVWGHAKLAAVSLCRRFRRTAPPQARGQLLWVSNEWPRLWQCQPGKRIRGRGRGRPRCMSLLQREALGEESRNLVASLGHAPIGASRPDESTTIVPHMKQVPPPPIKGAVIWEMARPLPPSWQCTPWGPSCLASRICCRPVADTPVAMRHMSSPPTTGRHRAMCGIARRCGRDNTRRQEGRRKSNEQTGACRSGARGERQVSEAPFRRRDPHG